MAAPPVDRRSYADLVRQTEDLLERYTAWRRPIGAPDPGDALARIFARFCEILVDRLNRAPEKNFLAFLNLLGLEPAPPRAARAPLTFALAPGSPADALVPERTQVAAAPTEGDSEPVVFETERDLVVTRSRLVEVFNREPQRDRYLEGPADLFPAFQGSLPIPHRLSLAHDLLALPEKSTLKIRLTPGDAQKPWPAALDWTCWDGAEWQSLGSPLPAFVSGGWEVTFTRPPAGTLVRAELRTPLPQQRPGAPAAIDGADHDITNDAFYLGSAEAFSKPGAQVSIRMELAETGATEPAIRWEYSTRSGWEQLTGLNDGTQGFTRSGMIAFRCPQTWRDAEWAGVRSYWLRAGGVRKPPHIVKLDVDYNWDLPRLQSVTIAVTVDRSALAPDKLFSNQAELDPTKFIFPFGERPRLNDAFYVASDEAFSKPGAVVTLAVKVVNSGSSEAGLPPPATPVNLSLAWETWDGKTWQAMSANDKTGGFVRDEIVTLTLPKTVAPVEVNGQSRHWVRVRIEKGDYGHEATYEPNDPNEPAKGYRLVAATLKPPALRSVAIAFTYQPAAELPTAAKTENDFVVVDRTAALLAGRAFEPFTPPADQEPALYLGFDTAFANRSAALYFSVAEIAYDPSSSTPAAAAQPEVVWEYWNGSRWAHLGVRDETDAFTRRGLVSFVGPADFRASAEFGRTAFWLRARWTAGSYAAPPRLQRILTNTTWASHLTSVRNETLGSSTGREGQVFRTAKSPVLAGERIEVAEPEWPSAAESATAWEQNGTIWVLWNAAPDFHASGPRSRHYTVNRLTGEVSFGDGQRGMTPPQGRANVRATYRAGGGSRGNRPAGAITGMKTAVPLVAGVSNPEPAEGGADAEELEAVKARGPKSLRHSGRAVTAADFEDLALAGFPEIALAKCVADAGSVSLVVVPRSKAARPVPGLELLGRVEDYLRERAAPAVVFRAIGPDWVQVTVTAEVAPLSIEAATQVQTAILARCAEFLHPLTGGLDGKGWAFGRRPYRSDLIALIEAIPGVSHVRALEVEEEPAGGGALPDRFLVFSGDHRITTAAEV